MFQLVRNPGKTNHSDDKSVHYYDNDDWPDHPPVGMWLEYGLVNNFMREQCLRKEQLNNEEISEDEYFEWKINWPATSSKVDYNRKDDNIICFTDYLGKNLRFFRIVEISYTIRNAVTNGENNNFRIISKFAL